MPSARRRGPARPTSISTTSATPPPTPTSIARRSRDPGVVVLHDWNLHQLVLLETVERGDTTAYLRADAPRARRRRVARGPPGRAGPGRADAARALPAERTAPARARLAVVALTRSATARRGASAWRAPGAAPAAPLCLAARPLALAATRRGARSAGPDDGCCVVAPGPGDRAQAARLIVTAVARLRRRFPRLRLVVAGDVDPALPLERVGGTGRPGRGPGRDRAPEPRRLRAHAGRRRRRVGPALPFARGDVRRAGAGARRRPPGARHRRHARLRGVPGRARGAYRPRRAGRGLLEGCLGALACRSRPARHDRTLGPGVRSGAARPA